MTNQIALVLAILVIAFFGTDFLIMDGSMSLFLGKKMLEFTEWLAFWR
ncbi:glyceraldehyde-3-phosphate dehydrogenase [Aliiroseovarius sp.]